MKKVIKLVGILCTLSLFFTMFAGCASKNSTVATGSSNSTTTTDPKEDVVLRFSWWGGDARHKTTLDALKLYSQKFPNITVEGEYGGWDGYVQKLSTQIAGGSAPDLISIPDIEAYNLINQGSLLDLSDNKLVDTTIFDDNLLTKITVGGKKYGLPLNVSLDMCAIINSDFFKKYSIPLDTKWDYDNLIEIGQKVHQQNNKAYLLNSNMDILTKMGAFYIMQKTGKLAVTSDFTINFTKEDYVDMLMAMKKLSDANVIQPIAETSLFAGADNPKWINGEAGMTFDCNTIIPSVYRKDDLNLAVANMAVIKDAKDPFLGSSTNMFIGINSASEHKEEAGKFIDWIFKDKDAILTLKESRGTQPTEAARKILNDSNIGDKLVTDSFNLATQAGGTTPLLYVGGDEIRKIENDVFQRVLLGKDTPEAAADYYFKAVTPLFADMKAGAAK